MRGKPSVITLSSWSRTMSGFAAFSQPARCTIRLRTELTFQAATRTAIDMPSDGEGSAAAAGRGCVGVAHLERGVDKILDEVDLGTGQQVERSRVHEQLHP